MRRHCWTIVVAGLFSLGMFGCALSSEMEPEDDSESAGSAAPALDDTPTCESF